MWKTKFYLSKDKAYQEVSSKVIGPVSSGEWFDCNVGKAGLSHPIAEPWLKAMMFAEIWIKRNG